MILGSLSMNAKEVCCMHMTGCEVEDFFDTTMDYGVDEMHMQDNAHVTGRLFITLSPV